MFELHGLKFSQMATLLFLFGSVISTGSSLLAVTLGPYGSVCYPKDLPLTTENVTICAFVRPSIPEEKAPAVSPASTMEETSKRVLFTLYNTEIFMEAKFVDSLLEITYGEKVFTFGSFFEVGVWRRVCMSYNPLLSLIEAKMDHLNLGLLEVKLAKNDTDRQYGLCIGSPLETTSTIAGAVTAFSVINWNSSLAPIFPEADCSNLAPEDTLVALDDSWNVRGNAQLENYNVAAFCDAAYVSVVIMRFLGYIPHLHLCLSLGGRFMSSGELKDNLLKSIAVYTQSCEPQNGRVFWYGEQPLLKLDIQGLCSAALPEGKESVQRCITELNCSVCLLPTNITFTLYGEVLTMDRSYTLLNLDDGSFFFKGKDSSEIKYNGSHWTLVSAFHSHQWFILNSSFPWGRNVWQSNEKIKNLTLTHCSESHFACNNGMCIKKKNLCDGIDDCQDGDDENDCSILWMSNGYKKASSPSNADVPQPFLYYEIKILSIGDISTDDGEVDIEFDLHMSWYDSRIEYQNLKVKWNVFPCEDVWNPKLIAMAGYGSGHKYQFDTYSKVCAVLHHHPKQTVDFMDPWMGEFLNGGKHRLSMSLNSFLEIPCSFRLERYPFGSYVCNITFLMINGGRGTHFKSSRPGNTITYKGNHDLLEFRLDEITFETLDEYSVILTLHLTSLYEYHVLNSFAPSALMFFICLSTFFFPLDNFNERIMVSLTALLVLAALFTQASSSSVKTAYYKLLDVWYACLITLCFTSVIMVSCVNAIFIRKTSDLIINIQVKPAFDNRSPAQTSTRPPHRRANICNAICAVVLLLLFLMLAGLYCSFAAGAE